MLTGVAITIPTVLAGLRGFPFGWEYLVVVILLFLLFYIRVYGPRNGSASRASRGGSHRHSAVSRRRPNRP